MPTLFNGCGCGPPPPLTVASAWTWIGHPVSGLRLLTCAQLKLGFPAAPGLKPLALPAHAARRTVLQKVRGHTCEVLPQLAGTAFQVLFHSPPGVLFTFPSRYLFSIGHQVVFSLGGWSPRLPTGFLVSCGTLDTRHTRHLRVPDFYRLRSGFPAVFCFVSSYLCGSETPSVRRRTVWALSRSLAATEKIDLSFSSSGYLDVSVHRVPRMTLWIHVMLI